MPVDSIGTLIVDLALEVTATSVEATAVLAPPTGWNDPPHPWQRIAAGCGHTILHC